MGFFPDSRSILDPLGTVLGPFWDLLGPLWRLFGASWGLLGTFWAPLGRSWGDLERSWVGTFWAALGPLWGRSWALPGASGRSGLHFEASEGGFWASRESIWDTTAVLAFPSNLLSIC